LRRRFGEDKVTEHRGQVLDFLAMTFDFTVPGEARVTMRRLVDDILEGCGVLEVRALSRCCDAQCTAVTGNYTRNTVGSTPPITLFTRINGSKNVVKRSASGYRMHPSVTQKHELAGLGNAQ
jgi:hypothetical protein